MFKILMLLLIPFYLIGISAPARQTKQESQQDLQTVEEDFKIKVDVNLVTLDVAVIGAAPTQLYAEDFAIYDDDIAQQTSYFSHDQLPLAVAILIDRSVSISGYLHMLQIAAISALRRLKPEDQVALFTFDFEHSKLSDLTEDKPLIAAKISKIGIGGATNIYDPIYRVTQYLKKNAPHRRRAIILISDNDHSVPDNIYTPDDCLVQLLGTAITLYSLKIGSDDGSESVPAIMQLAEKTGGEVLNVREPTLLKAALDKAMFRFRMQYTLGFNPSNPGSYGSYHRLAVKLARADRCPKCQLLVRSGYYTGISSPLPPSNEVRTPQPQSSLDIDQKLVQRIILAAAAAAVDMPDIPFLVSTTEQKDSKGQLQVKVDLKIHPDATNLITPDFCKLQVAVFYVNNKGQLLGYDWKRIEWRPSGEAYNRDIKAQIPFATVIPLKEKDQILRIVIYDEETDKVGSKLIPLHKPIKKK